MDLEHEDGVVDDAGGTPTVHRPAPHSGGDAPSISKTASGLSALARAEARAQELSGASTGPRAPGERSGTVPRLSSLSSRPRPKHARRRRWSFSLPRFRGSGRARRGSAWGRPRRARLRRLAIGVLAAMVAVVVLAVAFGVVQLVRSVPRPSLQVSTRPRTVGVNAHRPALPWPASGEAAAALVGFGTLGTSGPLTPEPIASLTKVMVAMVVLRDHPLKAGATGPQLTVTPADQAAYQAEFAAGDSVAPVLAGESLSELQLLQALLIPSADNVASILASWDSGSEEAFIARMNAAARSLGMTSTHYADTNGLSSATVSTASDQLRLAEAAAANAVLMSIVGESSVDLPTSGILNNYDTLLGHGGVVGIKTGSTMAAGGCFMLAAERTVGGRKVEVVGVVLGQHATPWIKSALDASAALVSPAFSALHPFVVVPKGTAVATIKVPWGSEVQVTTTKAVSILGFPGMTARVSVHPSAEVLSRSLPAGYRAATVTVSAGNETQTVPAVTSQAITGPSLSWRMERL